MTPQFERHLSDMFIHKSSSKLLFHSLDQPWQMCFSSQHPNPDSKLNIPTCQPAKCYLSAYMTRREIAQHWKFPNYPTTCNRSKPGYLTWRLSMNFWTQNPLQTSPAKRQHRCSCGWSHCLPMQKWPQNRALQLPLLQSSSWAQKDLKGVAFWRKSFGDGSRHAPKHQSPIMKCESSVCLVFQQRVDQIKVYIAV